MEHQNFEVLSLRSQQWLDKFIQWLCRYNARMELRRNYDRLELLRTVVLYWARAAMALPPELVSSSDSESDDDLPLSESSGDMSE